jgi:site-specific DNA-methyltransferase (adenine-specific)
MLNQIIHGDCFEVLKDIPDNSIDMTLTSPPYDNLRTYNGSLEWGDHIWKPIIKELYRVTKNGGVVVWIVGDTTIKGSETGTSFKQALWAKECGFNLHDTMIWRKTNPMPQGESGKRYTWAFEYMFVFSRGSIKTFNPLKEKTKNFGKKCSSNGHRREDGFVRKKTKAAIDGTYKEYKLLTNVWDIPTNSYSGCLKYSGHPATFPKKIAQSHILSWSNEGDIVLDPFCGSGTTALACKELGRNYICIEKEKEYFDIACDRINQPREYSELEIEIKELNKPEFKQLSLLDLI